MVARRTAVDGGAAAPMPGNRRMVARLRKAGSSCAPEKIWAVIQAALGGRSMNVKAALEAASKEAAIPRRPLLTKRSRRDEPGVLQLKGSGKKSPPAKKTAVKSELVDLNQFENLVDLVNAWVRTKGSPGGRAKHTLQREPSMKREPVTTSAAKTKSEPVVKKELVNEIRKLDRKVLEGIIDLTEAVQGESQPRSAQKRSTLAAQRSSFPTVRLSLAHAADQKTRPLAAAAGKPRSPLRAKKQPQAQDKRFAKEKKASKKTPQVVRNLNKVASTCAPQKLWAILKAAAQAPGPSASVGAALRVARGTATSKRQPGPGSGGS